MHSCPNSLGKTLYTDKSHHTSRPQGQCTRVGLRFYRHLRYEYTKQTITLAEQIRTLQARGLIIDNEADATLMLERISYFRLADYWRPLEINKVTHQFADGSCFSEVVACYNFDKELKVLLFSGIQTIEVAVRAKVIKQFSQTSGPFWFMDAANAINSDHFQSNLARIRTDGSDIDHFLDIIRTGKYRIRKNDQESRSLKDVISEIRGLDDHDAQNRIKRGWLPVACINGTFKYKDDNGIDSYSSFLALDYDGFKTPQEMEEARGLPG